MGETLVLVWEEGLKVGRVNFERKENTTP